MAEFLKQYLLFLKWIKNEIQAQKKKKSLNISLNHLDLQPLFIKAFKI